YSPEPGPASILKVRLEYDDGQGKLHSFWTAVPKLDKYGRPEYPVALEYQRFLAVTENLSRPHPLPPPAVPDAGGNPKFNPVYERLKHAPAGPGMTPPAILGVPRPDRRLIIPFHPNIRPEVNQLQAPNFQSRELLKSYARHLARTPH